MSKHVFFIFLHSFRYLSRIFTMCQALFQAQRIHGEHTQEPTELTFQCVCGGVEKHSGVKKWKVLFLDRDLVITVTLCLRPALIIYSSPYMIGVRSCLCSQRELKKAGAGNRVQTFSEVSDNDCKMGNGYVWGKK